MNLAKATLVYVQIIRNKRKVYVNHNTRDFTQLSIPTISVDWLTNGRSIAVWARDTGVEWSRGSPQPDGTAFRADPPP